MRARRLLWLWCAGLLVAGVGGLGGFGSSARALLVTGPPPGSEVPTPEERPATVAAPLGTATESRPAARPSAGPPSSVTAPAAPAAPGTTVTPTTGVVAPSPTTTVAPGLENLLACTVNRNMPPSRLSTGLATVGWYGASTPIAVDNCRPFTGDVVTVHARQLSPWGVLQLDFGDGTLAGKATGGCVPIVANDVEAEHRYAKAGRYLVEATTRFPCTPDQPVVHRVWIEVSEGRVPEVAGAAPCRGLGPVKLGEQARQGVGIRLTDVPRVGEMEVKLVRCSVALGEQSEVFLWWYQVKAVVSWGDGTQPEAIGGPGQQGASSLHAYAARGLHVATVWVLGADGAPGPPLTFTVLVS